MRFKLDSVQDVPVLGIRDKKELETSPYHLKTWYLVYELKSDYYFSSSCIGLMGSVSKTYPKGYYVIPVYLQLCIGMSEANEEYPMIKMTPRDFCDMFGRPWSNEPQDVPRDKWSIASKFKEYFGLYGDSHSFGYGKRAYTEGQELYDDVEEAISRAKELDQRMKLSDSLQKVNIALDDNIEKRNNARVFLKKCANKTALTKRQSLEKELREIALNNCLERIKTLERKKLSIENKIEKVIPYNYYNE